MKLPEHISESEFVAVVDKVAKVISRQLSIPTYDREDVEQLVRLRAVEVVEDYQAEAGPLDGYLFRCCRNHVLNSARPFVGRWQEVPCQVCLDADTGAGPGHPDGAVCSAYERWRKACEGRSRLSRPTPLEGIDDEGEGGMSLDSTVEQQADYNDLLARIDEELPLDLRAAYLRMLAGDINISSHQRQAVRREVRRILLDAGAEEERLVTHPRSRD